MTDVVEVSITRLGSAGDGVGALSDGTPLFVAGGLPGETVRAEPTARRGDGVSATLVEVLVASPDRVEPPCPHFGVCGGCAIQHMSLEAGVAWKRGRLDEALARGGFPDFPITIAPPTPPLTRRRADLALSRLPDGTVAIGLHAHGSATVTDLRACMVLDPRLFALIAPLRAVLKRMQALRRSGSAVLNLLDTGPDLLLRTDGPLDSPARGMLAAFGPANGVPRIAWALGNDPTEIAAQAGPVALDLSGTVVVPAPGAFLQASPSGEAAIIAAVLAGLPTKKVGRGRIADLYAGIGTLSVPLSTRGPVAAFEGEAEAVAALGSAAGRSGARLAATRRDLARQPLLPAELDKFAAVVLDPPFGGALEQIAMIARSKVTTVVYVSCNPMALGRDIRVLAEVGFRVTAATLIDQFLWSSQVEAVVALSRA